MNHDALLNELRELIHDARSQALRAVDVLQVRTCWQVGHHIVEYEQQGDARAIYGAKLIPELSKQLTKEFGRGFDSTNLQKMRKFYQLFPNWNALRSELSWTHYRRLLRVENEDARQWYMN